MGILHHGMYVSLQRKACHGRPHARWCLQEQQEQQQQRQGSQEFTLERQRRYAEVIRDLSEEIQRMKAAEQRKTSAFTTLTTILENVRRVSEQIASVRITTC